MTGAADRTVRAYRYIRRKTSPESDLPSNRFRVVTPRSGMAGSPQRSARAADDPSRWLQRRPDLRERGRRPPLHLRDARGPAREPNAPRHAEANFASAFARLVS